MSVALVTYMSAKEDKDNAVVAVRFSMVIIACQSISHIAKGGLSVPVANHLKEG